MVQYSRLHSIKAYFIASSFNTQLIELSEEDRNLYTVKNDVLYGHKNCVILMHFFDMSVHVILTYF